MDMGSQTVAASTAATTENDLGDLLASFSGGCSNCDYRDRWLLVSARNVGARESLRGRGIKHLADVLEREDVAAVESIVKPLLRSKANPAKLPTDITAPADVKVYKASGEQTIGDKAFNWAMALTAVTLGDGLQTIGDYAFYYASALTSMTCFGL